MPVFLVRFYKLRGEPGLQLRRCSERLTLLVAKTPENVISQLSGVRGQSGSNLFSQEVLNVFCQSNPHANNIPCQLAGATGGSHQLAVTPMIPSSEFLRISVYQRGLAHSLLFGLLRANVASSIKNAFYQSAASLPLDPAFCLLCQNPCLSVVAACQGSLVKSFPRSCHKNVSQLSCKIQPLLFVLSLISKKPRKLLGHF
jgi:hypothetical protein